MVLFQFDVRKRLFRAQATNKKNVLVNLSFKEQFFSRFYLFFLVSGGSHLYIYKCTAGKLSDVIMCLCLCVLVYKM